MRSYRLRCRLLGCDDVYGPGCAWCPACRYDPDFIDRGLLAPLSEAWRRVRDWAWPRCGECRRRLWPWRRPRDEYCSAECRGKDHIPF
jgi:hypothetical protein